MSGPTFEDNMVYLLRLKQEALTLKASYQKGIVSVFHRDTLAHHERQLEEASIEIEDLRCSADQSNAVFNQLTAELKALNDRLKYENNDLKVRNSELMDKYHDSQQFTDRQSEQLKSIVTAKEMEIAKTKRDIENIKLMHSQELYILKKTSAAKK